MEKEESKNKIKNQRIKGSERNHSKQHRLFLAAKVCAENKASKSSRADFF